MHVIPPFPTPGRLMIARLQGGRDAASAGSGAAFHQRPVQQLIAAERGRWAPAPQAPAPSEHSPTRRSYEAKYRAYQADTNSVGGMIDFYA